MALNSTITYESPDRVEGQIDKTTEERYTWNNTGPDAYEAVLVGVYVFSKTVTTKTWVSCTLAACTTFVAAYEGTGSISYNETVPALHAYDLTLVETTESSTFTPEEEE